MTPLKVASQGVGLVDDADLLVAGSMVAIVFVAMVDGLLAIVLLIQRW